MMGEILKQYTEARMNERLHLSLQCPDLRSSFQEIDRKDLAFNALACHVDDDCASHTIANGCDTRGVNVGLLLQEIHS